MNILLVAINAKYIHSNPAVYSLKAYADLYCEGVDIQIAEYTINQPMEEIRGDIYGKNPDVIGFSCYIWNRTLIADIIKDLKKILPNTDIWLGGPEVSYDVPEVLHELPVRGVMTGYGEASFRKLAEAYSYGKQVELPAILSDPAVPMNELPFWYRDLTGFEHRIIYYESSRGCPFSCAYCLSAVDKKLTFRDVSQVEQELSFFLEKRVPQVKFIDRTFNCKKQHAMAIWEFIRDHDNGVTNFHFEVAADLMDRDMLDVLCKMRPGAVQLEIGVQSTCPETLKAINRPMDFGRVAEVTGEIRSWHNIHQHLDLIAGLPYEDYDRFGQSFNDVYGLQPDQLQLGFLKVLKGSPMEKLGAGYGLMHTAKPPYEVLATQWLPYRDVLKLKGVEAVLEIYYNSGQFSHTLKQLETHFPSPFAFYEALADWYETHGLSGIQSSRVKKYEILLSFALHHDGANEALYRELLTLDLYLRENMKNRPDFCPERDEDKQIIRQWMEEAAEGIHTPEGYEGLSSRELARRLHGEVFYTLGESLQLCIFDYRYRDPLTYNARVIKTQMIPDKRKVSAMI